MPSALQQVSETAGVETLHELTNSTFIPESQAETFSQVWLCKTDSISGSHAAGMCFQHHLSPDFVFIILELVDHLKLLNKVLANAIGLLLY